MANKINLSCLTIAAMLLSLTALVVEAQVPPRSEAAQEQREEKAPLETIEWETSIIQEVSGVASCSLTFIGKAGKQGVLDFCGEEVTYSGDLKANEAAKVFFEYLRDYLAACGEKSGTFIRTCPPDPTGKSACAPGTQRED